MPFGKIFAALKGHHKAAEEPKPQEEPVVEAPIETPVERVDVPISVEETNPEPEEEIKKVEDKHDQLEKAIFDSSTGFGDDWTEEADWGSTPAPAELENDDGWTTKTSKTTTKSKKSKGKKYQGSQKRKPIVKKEEEEKLDQSIVHPTQMHALLATMDVEDELGVELAISDDDSEEESVEQNENVENQSSEKVHEISKPKATQNLSKKEKQELKKKELEDIDAMLAELGVNTKSTSETEPKTDSSKAAKRRAKKERKAANGVSQTQNAQHQITSSSEEEDASAPAIDPDAIKAAKTAMKKKSAPKKLSAAQAAAKAAASKGKKKSKDASKFNELYGR